MKREIHPLIQGSAEWHAFRACHDGASEAAAMMGLSKHTTRSELLRQKSTGLAKEVSAFTQSIFDRGHAVEVLAATIAEEVIGEALYPGTYSFGKMSASVDGITISGDAAWEHKQFNAALFAAVKRGELPEEHMPQCQQIMYVTRADGLLFMCSDGTRDKCAHMWVNVDLLWQNRLLSGWEQFNTDLAAYVRVEAAPVAVATPTMALPALSIQVNGSLTLIDNLSAFGERLHAFIDGIDKSPSDDQAFADAEAAIKVLEKAEDALERERERALGQTASISEMINTVALYADLARATRLVLTKMVKARKETIKIEIIDKGKKALAEHIESLNAQFGKPLMPAVPADFAGAVKGLRTVSSMLDAVGVELARAIISANAIAGDIHLVNKLSNTGAVASLSDITRDTIKPPTNAQLVASVAIYWGVGESIAVEWLMAWQPTRE